MRAEQLEKTSDYTYVQHVNCICIERLRIKPPCCECWSVNHCAAPTRSYWTRRVHLSPDYSSLIILQPCSMSGSPVELNPLSLHVPPLPLSVHLSLLIPLAGGHLPSRAAEAGSVVPSPDPRLFTMRLNRPVWTAVRGRLPLCGHISAAIHLHPSSNHASVHL